MSYPEIIPYSGVRLILVERDYQYDELHYTDSHDDKHTRGELVQAAKLYISEYQDLVDGLEPQQEAPLTWPWDEDTWHPTDNKLKLLVKAGALIAAEIDRIERKKRDEASQNG
jgi:hypothetical protein